MSRLAGVAEVGNGVGACLTEPVGGGGMLNGLPPRCCGRIGAGGPGGPLTGGCPKFAHCGWEP